MTVLAIRLTVAAVLSVAATLPGALSAQRRTPAQRATDQYDDTFRKYSKRYFSVGHDWRYFKAQAMAESDLNPAAKSWVGARGLMQLMPTTYQEIRSKRPEFGEIDDPEWNIAAGIAHDRYLWRLWKDHAPDDERRACMFAAYNAGQGTLNRAHRMAKTELLDEHAWSSIQQVAPKVGRWRYRETLGYVGKIDANYKRLREAEAARRGGKTPAGR